MIVMKKLWELKVGLVFYLIVSRGFTNIKPHNKDLVFVEHHQLKTRWVRKLDVRKKKRTLQFRIWQGEMYWKIFGDRSG